MNIDTDMKAYSDYLIFQSEDFLRDPPFRQWITRPTSEMDAYWKGLLRTYPHLREAFSEANVLAQGMELSWSAFSDEYVGQLFQQLRPGLLPVPRERRVVWMPYIGFAAAAILLLVSGLWVDSYYFTGKTYQTRFAQTSIVKLYDGSVVTLNANSRLSLPSRYAWRQGRSVSLDGEAYFAVHKQPSASGNKKFTVQTSRVAVEVLGTQFNLYARPLRTVVLLDEGRIRLVEKATNQPLLMRPGQVVELSPQQTKPSLAQTAPGQSRQLTDWRYNRLIFNDADMAELASRFQEVYGLELVLQDEAFAGQQFRGELPVTDLKEALLTLSAAFERKAVRDGERIYFIHE
jgi:transmembrane sensor